MDYAGHNDGSDAANIDYFVTNADYAGTAGNYFETLQMGCVVALAKTDYALDGDSYKRSFGVGNYNVEHW